MSAQLQTAWASAKAGLSKSASVTAHPGLSFVVGNISAAIPLMQKEALNPAQSVVKGLGWAGSKLQGLGSEAKALAKPKALQGIRDSGGIAAIGGRAEGAKILQKAKAVGDKRLAAGGALSGLGKTISESDKIQKSINVGTKGLAAGGALYGAHELGESGGRVEGLESGATQGFDAGIQAGAQQSTMDPGILARLMEVFTGRQSSAVNLADPEVAARRQATLQRILAGK